MQDIGHSQKNFILSLSAISVVGLIMVYSSSYIYGKEVFGSSLHFISRQLIFMLFGITGAFIVWKTKINFWLKNALYLNIFVTFLLLLTFMPGLGVSVKGAARWLNLGFLTFQPGELIKYSLILASLNYFEGFLRLTNRERVLHGVSLVLPLFLLIKQPDFGTFSICFFLMIFVCFLSSFPRKWFYTIFSAGTILGAFVLFTQAYRVKRILTFLDPWKNSKTSGFQIIQSYLAFANGSFFGQGLGNSTEKLFYLPEAHNDFIFSVIGEEVGFLGVIIVILAFLAFIYFGFKCAVEVKDRINTILISSLVFTLALQAALNMGVVLGLLPTKGLNLPFISYGGSSLVCNFFAIGLIMSAIRSENNWQDSGGLGNNSW